MRSILAVGRGAALVALTIDVCACGLVFQGTSQTVLITTVPTGAAVSFAGHETLSPARIRFNRRQTWVVARASKEGYQSACQVVACDMNAKLVVFDSFAVAIPFLFDFALGTLRRCPPIELRLNELPKGTGLRVLPSDAEVLTAWKSGRHDLCVPPAPVPPLEAWEASFDVALETVDRPGQPKVRYGPVERVGNITREKRLIPKFGYRDSNISITMLAVWDGIEFELENRTQHAEKIVWDEVVFVDFDSSSQRVIHEGVRYVDRNLSQPPSVVAPGKLLRDKIVPVQRIIQGDGGFHHLHMVPSAYRRCEEPEEQFIQSMEALKGAPFSVLFPIEVGGTVNEYTFNFLIEGVQLRTSRTCTQPSVLSTDATVRRGSW